MIQMTETAVNKVKEILSAQEPNRPGLRISVVGGGMLRIQLLHGFRERARACSTRSTNSAG